MKLRGNQFDKSAVEIEKIAGDIKTAIIRKKEEWLEYYMRKLLGDDVAAQAIKEPAIVRSIMKERSIWLKEDGNTMTLYEGENVVSKFVLEFKHDQPGNT